MQIRYTKSDQNQKGGYTVFPEGSYDVEITDVKSTRSSTGKPQLEVSGTIVSGPYADKTMKVWLTTTKKAVWVFNNFCDALNIEEVDTGEEDENGETIYARDPEEMIGRVIQLGCSQRKHNNKTYNDWEPLGTSEFDTMGDEVTDDEELEASDDEEEPEEEAKASSNGSKAAKGNKGKRGRPRPRRR